MLVSAGSRAGQLPHLPVPAWKPVAAFLSVSSLTLSCSSAPSFTRLAEAGGGGLSNCLSCRPSLSLLSHYLSARGSTFDTHSGHNTYLPKLFPPPPLPSTTGNLVRPHLCHYLIMGSKACIMMASQLPLLQNYLKYPVSTRSHSLVSG